MVKEEQLAVVLKNREQLTVNLFPVLHLIIKVIEVVDQ